MKRIMKSLLIFTISLTTMAFLLSSTNYVTTTIYAEDEITEEPTNSNEEGQEEVPDEALIEEPDYVEPSQESDDSQKENEEIMIQEETVENDEETTSSLTPGWTQLGDSIEWQIDDKGTLTIRPLGNGSEGTLKGNSWPWKNNTSIQNIVISGKVNVASDMSYFCSGLRNLTSIDFSGLDWSNSQVTNMIGMFSGCKSLTSLDLSNFNTSKVTSMSNMFSGCSSLTSLDLSNFDTSHVYDMSNMFNGCSKLTSLDVSNFNTPNVTSMSNMFSGCSSLETLDLSSFKTSNVTSMFYMFSSCSNLASLDLSNFKTSNVTNMSNMFYGCSNLASLDLSSFDTSKVTNMSFMFYGCSNLTSLDLSSFDTSKVDTMAHMLGYDKMKKITLSDKFQFITSSSGQEPVFPYLNEGRWLSSADGVYYDSDKIPSNVASTYTFVKCCSLTFMPCEGSVSETTRQVPTGSEYGELPTPTRSGYTFVGWYTSAIGGTKVTSTTIMGTSDTTVYAHWTTGMYRVYNPNSGEHFYTASSGEKDYLVSVGWNYEGIEWIAPSVSNTPVYRLYSGTDHHYTTNSAERDSLVKAGWSYEGIGWYSDDDEGVPLYRQFNPNVDPGASRNNSGSHNYTTSKAENDHLVKVGWRAEGIGWYGVKD